MSKQQEKGCIKRLLSIYHEPQRGCARDEKINKTLCVVSSNIQAVERDRLVKVIMSVRAQPETDTRNRGHLQGLHLSQGILSAGQEGTLSPSVTPISSLRGEEGPLRTETRRANPRRGEFSPNLLGDRGANCAMKAEWHVRG